MFYKALRINVNFIDIIFDISMFTGLVIIILYALIGFLCRA